MITNQQKIFMAGHRGMKWKHFCMEAFAECKGYSNLIGKTSTELDLKNQKAVDEFYNLEKPKVVIDVLLKLVAY